MGKIKVMLVDDQVLLREGLKTIINLQDDMEVVSEADNGQMAVENILDQKVDVVLMDIRMPVLNGVDATAVIKENFPHTAIIILTTFDDDDYIIDALSNGADGYLLKDIDAPHLTKAIRDAHSGQMMLPGKIAAKLASRLSGKQVYKSLNRDEGISSYQSLTHREIEIGGLMVEGFTNSQIARKLFLTEGTVKNYISEIYSKLGTNNRMNAILLIKQMLQK